MSQDIRISIPKADLARSFPISDGWHEFEVIGVRAAPGKKDANSVTYTITHKLVGDANEREIDHYFSSKALGRMNVWIAALTNKTVQEVLDSITTGTLDFSLSAQVGKHLMGKIGQEIVEGTGQVSSKMQDFAPVGKVPF